MSAAITQRTLRSFGIAMLVSAMIGLAFLTILFGDLRTRNRLERGLSDLPRIVVQLSDAIGFGGLIHHFKNLVLRRDLRFAAMAREDYAKAVELIDLLLKATEELEIEVELDSLLHTLAYYRDNIAVAELMIDDGSTIDEIDLAVRLDDSAALADLLGIERAIEAAIDREIDQMDLRLRVVAGLLIMSLLGFSTAAWKRHAKLAEARLRASLAEERESAIKEQNALLESKVRERTKDLELFTHIAAHDLRAPLRAMNLVATMIEEDLTAAGVKLDSEFGMTMLRDQSQRMDAVITGLLALAAAGAGRTDGSELACVREAAMEVVALLETGFKGHNVIISEDLPIVAMSRTEVELILRNLIGNAVKYHDRDNGRIVASGGTKDEEVWFAVTDDGPGVPEEFRAAILEPFRRLHSKDSIEGSGLGLAVVRRVVERHGGSIAVMSAEPRGTSFRITLPAAPAQSPHARGNEEMESGPAKIYAFASGGH